MIVDMTKINGIPVENYASNAMQFLTFPMSLPVGANGVWVNNIYHSLQPQRPKYRGFIKTVGRTRG